MFTDWTMTDPSYFYMRGIIFGAVIASLVSTAIWMKIK